MKNVVSTEFAPVINLEGVRIVNHFHPVGFPPLSREILSSIVSRIATNPQVNKIILFGSYASLSKIPTPDSDIDLLVIMDTTASPSDRILSVTRLLRPRPFPMDILVRTPQEMDALLDSGDDFFLEIIAHGKVLCER